MVLFPGYLCAKESQTCTVERRFLNLPTTAILMPWPSAQNTIPLKDLTDNLCRAVMWNGKRVRALTLLP